ncbi:MAG: hypothetical protein ACOZAA_15830 [Pseudomonadota bacterium]
MMKSASIAILTAAALTAGGGAAAKPGHGKGGAAAPASSEHEHKAGLDVDVSIALGDAERRIVRDYYGSNCPPGLAKKNNGCLPPGQAKKRYAIGRRVPDGVNIEILPNEVIVRLPGLPSGYGYRMVDGDLVIVALATLVVLDAVGLF